MDQSIKKYHAALDAEASAICELLADTIEAQLPKAESKVWHGNPVWFLEGNPIVGYSQQKAGIRLMFWSGADFEEAGLLLRGKKFKDASIIYTNIKEVKIPFLKRCLKKSIVIQWDYKNLVKRKGELKKLKINN